MSNLVPRWLTLKRFRWQCKFWNISTPKVYAHPWNHWVLINPTSLFTALLWCHLCWGKLKRIFQLSLLNHSYILTLVHKVVLAQPAIIAITRWFLRHAPCAAELIARSVGNNCCHPLSMSLTLHSPPGVLPLLNHAFCTPNSKTQSIPPQVLRPLHTNGANSEFV